MQNYLSATEYASISRLSKYSDYLGAYYAPFKLAFEHFEKNNGKFILELGSSKNRKFDSSFWRADEPENWDWSTGCFTYMVAECLNHIKPHISIIDVNEKSMKRTKFITKKFGFNFDYHVWPILDFLRYHPCDIHPIDLLYINAFNDKFNEDPANFQLEIAKMIIKRNFMSKNGIIILDNSSINTDQSRYALTYFLSQGFKMIFQGSQIILSKIG